MKTLLRLVGSRFAWSRVVVLIAILSVVGPVVVVCAGFWDAISHILQEPEFFWSPPHVVVYVGVSMTGVAAILGGIVLNRRLVHGTAITGVKLVMAGAAIQIVSGFADSLSHDVFGIDGLVSWSHQPLEFGLVLGALGAVFILKSMIHVRILRWMLPFSIMVFLFFVVWLAFNIALIFGHVIQCIPVYEIFSSGCAVL